MALTNAVVAPRYARALFEAAEESAVSSSVAEELAAMNEIIAQNPTLLETLSAKTVAAKDKQQLLDTLKSEASSLVANLLQVTFEYGRIAALPAIIADYQQRYADAIGQLDATVTTAVPLTDAQQQALSQAIAKRFAAKQVRLDPQVDPTVIGGVLVQTRQVVVDGTVQTRMTKLRRALLAK